MTDMKGKRAIVTGGGTGLGAATAVGLAKRGVNVCINYNSSADAAEKVVAECRKLGVDAFAVKANVAEDADCRALVEAATKKFGGLDVLVNNAGITKFVQHSDLDGLSADDFLSLYRVNVVGVFQMTRAARPHLDKAGQGRDRQHVVRRRRHRHRLVDRLRRDQGRTQHNDLEPCPRAGAQHSRQHGVPRLYRLGLVHEVPGLADRGQRRRACRQDQPAARRVQPEDIAGSIIFFAGPESRHITGEFIIVDAGMHLGYAPLRAR